ncbi:Uncharacterised protein [Segatella copri]|nr:Uncharacterised protein [Segatella copri]
MIAFKMQGDSLSQFGSIVLNGDVLQGDVTALYLQGISAECTHRFTLYSSF